MQVDRLADGLWRWTAPHPDWLEGGDPESGWDQHVTCLYHEAPDGIVLIDPLVPIGEDGARFWLSLDQDVARVGRPLTVIVSCAWHRRSADLVLARYDGARILTADELERGAMLPSVSTIVSDGPGQTRMVLVHCTCHRMLWTADLLIGTADSGLARPPRVWFDADDERAWMEVDLPKLLPRIAALGVDIAIPAHGRPVMTDGLAAIQRAFE